MRYLTWCYLPGEDLINHWTRVTSARVLWQRKTVPLVMMVRGLLSLLLAGGEPSEPSHARLLPHHCGAAPRADIAGNAVSHVTCIRLFIDATVLL